MTHSGSCHGSWFIPPISRNGASGSEMGSVSVSAQVRCVRIQQLNLVSVYTHTQLTWENIRRAKIQATPTLWQPSCFVRSALAVRSPRIDSFIKSMVVTQQRRSAEEEDFVQRLFLSGQRRESFLSSFPFFPPPFSDSSSSGLSV